MDYFEHAQLILSNSILHSIATQMKYTNFKHWLDTANPGSCSFMLGMPQYRSLAQAASFFLNLFYPARFPDL